MSFVFYISLDADGTEKAPNHLAVAEGDELLAWLGVQDAEWAGMLDPEDLSARCRRCLWPEMLHRAPDLAEPLRRLLSLSERARHLGELVMYTELELGGVAGPSLSPRS